MAPRDIVIVGAGGFGREVLDVLRATDPHQETFRFEGFVSDDEPDPEILQRIDAHWLGTVQDYLSKGGAPDYVVGIGRPQTRRAVVDRLEAAGLRAVTLIHPSATFGRDVEFGDGTVVCAHVSITTNVRMGRHVHVNLNCTIGHDARIGDFVSINPLTAVSGEVTLDEGVMLGTGSAVLQGLHIGSDSVVGAGAVVVKDVPPDVTVVGIPARQR
jgi:sugar O-acyltransferase (sialic acid O-acetyltransferase NeuD family)